MSGEVEVVRHPRARRMRLAIDPASGRVRLTLPPRMALARGLAWAEEQRGWIAAQRARFPQARPFVAGAVLPLDDRQVRIDWAETRPRGPRRAGDALLCGGPREGLAARVERWLRAEALRVLAAETRAMAAPAGIDVGRVSIGDPRSRWGSCSSSGAIRYSWRLILAPGFVRRATVAHEVAHCVHMNHGPAFHALVAELLGDDPRAATRWLRAHGATLHSFGRGSGSAEGPPGGGVSAAGGRGSR